MKKKIESLDAWYHRAFPEEPEAEGLGQKKPPADMREWRDFVAGF